MKIANLSDVAIDLKSLNSSPQNKFEKLISVILQNDFDSTLTLLAILKYYNVEYLDLTGLEKEVLSKVVSGSNNFIVIKQDLTPFVKSLKNDNELIIADSFPRFILLCMNYLKYLTK